MQRPMVGERGIFMACTEAYKEHIMYTFHGFCKVVIRNAAITAWRDQQRRHKRELAALRLRPRRGRAGQPRPLYQRARQRADTGDLG